MHICHVSGVYRGGPASSVPLLAESQLDAGHRVTVIYSPLRDELDDLRQRFRPEVAFRSWTVPREIEPKRDIAAWRELRQILREIRPDLVHLHSSKAGAIGRPVAFQLGIPSIYSPRGLSYVRRDVSGAKRAFYFVLEWSLALLGDCTVGCSMSEIGNLAHIPGEKRMIPNGIAVARLDPELHWRQPPHDGFRVALCGRITQARNPRLANELARASPASWDWTWIGDVELRMAAEHLSAIKVTGWLPREEVIARLAASDVLLHPSLWEGLPNVVMEAMALGLPVVASDCIGNRDLVVDGVTGYLIRRPEDYHAALEELAASPERRLAMGRAGRERIAADFDHAKLAPRWLELYAAHAAKERQPRVERPGTPATASND